MSKFDTSGPGIGVLNANFLRQPLTYDTVVLAFTTSRQPNAARPVMVVATVRIDCDDGEEGTVQFQTSPNNAVWTTRMSWRHSFSVSGLLGVTGSGHFAAPGTMIIRTADYYRLTTTNVSGTPTFSIVSITEEVL